MTAATRSKPQLPAQRAIRHKRYPLMNHLSMGQKQQFQRIIAAYRPDLHDPAPDPAAVEVLLILLEICHILDLLPNEIDHLFTPPVCKALETWEGAVVGVRRPPQNGRVWVWLPTQPRPQVRRIEANGVLRIGEEG